MIVNQIQIMQEIFTGGLIDKKNKNQGLTILEMAIVLVIIGIVLGFSFGIATRLKKLSLEKEVKNKILVIEKALIAYAKITGKFPFADSNGDGSPDSNVYLGFVPYKILKLSSGDIRGIFSKIHYDVNDDIAKIETARNICHILDSLIYQPSDASLIPTSLSDYPQINSQNNNVKVAFVLYSTGIDKVFSQENNDNNRIYEPANSNSDDIVVWETFSHLYEELNCGDEYYSVLNSSNGVISIQDRDNICKQYSSNEFFPVRKETKVYNSSNCVGQPKELFWNCAKADIDGDRDTEVEYNGNTVSDY